LIRGRDVRAGLRAGGAWLAASAVLILVGRLGGDGWGSLVGWLLIPLGLLGAPGQLAVNWGNLQKPAAGLNGLVAGSLAGLGGAAALLILGLPFGLWLLAPDAAAPASGARVGITPIVGLIVYTLAVICLLLTAFTSTTLAIVEAPAVEFEFPREGDPGPRPR
jgi:hypothetical protein